MYVYCFQWSAGCSLRGTKWIFIQKKLKFCIEIWKNPTKSLAADIYWWTDRHMDVIFNFFTPCAMVIKTQYIIATCNKLSVIYVIYILVRRVSVHFSIPSSVTNEDYWESPWCAKLLQSIAPSRIVSRFFFVVLQIPFVPSFCCSFWGII